MKLAPRKGPRLKGGRWGAGGVEHPTDGEVLRMSAGKKKKKKQLYEIWKRDSVSS